VGFGYVAPYSMVPDAIEADAVATGVRKEGAFYGMWLFTSKIGSAFLIAALVLVQFYPLDEKKYAELIASKPKP
jgi:GPH family glycoside/pentoside/hexuronide:cation symporter